MSFFFPQATDGNFVDKLNSKFKANPHFEVVRSHSPLFTVVHYAGKVEQTKMGGIKSQLTGFVMQNNINVGIWVMLTSWLVQVQYNASGFLEKNRDNIPASIRSLFINSVTPLLSVLFAGRLTCRYRKQGCTIKNMDYGFLFINKLFTPSYLNSVHNGVFFWTSKEVSAACLLISC